jgi:putative ABC transport system permease protein
MINNYLKTALRNIIRHKGISTINVAGLALGMACTILILLWVDQQLHMDKAQENRDSIYRLEAVDWVTLPTRYRQALADFPEIRQVVQFNHWETPTLKYQDRLFDTEDFAFVDKNVFEVFTLPLLKGDPQTALQEPLSLILTQSEARRIFGSEDPMGKTIRYDSQFDFTVTGIIEDVSDLHIKIKFLAPFESLPQIKDRPGFLSELNWNFSTYLLLNENTDISALEKKLNQALVEVDKSVENEDFFVRPFKEIYFASGIKFEKAVRHGNFQMLVLFSAVAIFILLIACSNFINLSTARSTLRAKEIGIRKVVGADQKKLFTQFMGEILLVALFAQIFALAIVGLALPVFSRLAGKEIMFNYTDPRLIAGLVLVFLFTGLAAGLFPALFLSSFSPIAVLRGKTIRSHKASPLRRVLIVFQFAVSIFLIIGTVTVFRQLHYMKTKDLGFDQKQVINVHLKGDLLGEKKSLFKDLLLRNPEISQVSFSSQEPGIISNTNTWKVNGQDKPMRVINTDPEYVDFMGLKLIEGRNLSWDRRTDIARAYVINQEAAKLLGFESPVGQTVRANFGGSMIIGIVKDYHYNSLQNRIGPLAICWYERWADIAHIKISGSRIDETVKYIGSLWTDLCPDFPFNFSFLDQDFARHYYQEDRLKDILKYFVGLAIFLSCLGLFGLSAFLAEQKTKEIGIRKILGSSSFGIMVLFSKDFSRWVLLANVFAWPVAYLVSHQWLQNFPYRTGVSVWTLLLSAAAALLISLITVSYQSIKAATATPINSLRYE